MHSNVTQVTRAPSDEIRMELLGDYVFVETVNRLVTNIAAMILQTSWLPIHIVILDFRRSRGLDSSAVASFGRLICLAKFSNFR